MTWLAVVHRMVDGGGRGYVLDIFPEERARHLRELGRAVIGEFASWREATKAVASALGDRSGFRSVAIRQNRFADCMPKRQVSSRDDRSASGTALAPKGEK